MSPAQLILTPLIVCSEGAMTDVVQESLEKLTEMRVVRLELCSGMVRVSRNAECLVTMEGGVTKVLFDELNSEW